MADEQKPTPVPETAPATTEAVTETKPVETTPATEAATAAETTTATETPAEATETAAAAETPAAAEEPKKEEVEPIEAGTLEHKGAPASFPKNIIFSKNHFWFGSEAMSSDKLATYLKNEKATDISHHIVSWAAETGKGLLFIAKESDKATPTGVIPLADASEPTTDGTNKFTFTSKGHKHAFKAPTTAVRDNWVSQLKLKIAEAKELAAAVTESENYKHTMESLNPTAAAKKEEKPAAETPKEEAAPEAPKEEAADEEEKKDEVKDEKKEDKKDRRSASRKRASLFGNLLGKKEEAKKETPAEEKPAEDKPAETTGTATAEVPAESTPATEPVVETPATETPAAPAETAESPKKEVPAKPATSKRSSIFGSLSFGKKKTATESGEAAPVTPVKETTAEAEPVAESAPVIPAMETTEPLSTEVTSPATAPTETAEATPATNGETKKEMKSDKRKSSLPFSFGKKDKAANSDEEGEKVKSPPFFSKLRQTVKGKGKAEEKPAEKPAEDKPAETAEPAAESKPEEAAAAEAKPEEAAPAPASEENAEKPVAAAPAPVTAAA
ncbi:hypothetical protein DL769_006082 [Monosporascus sp. CRB-8-3]|nr:hypothetical protein DL769_006082 [Monosporascus sp. CRB-8-3]